MILVTGSKGLIGKSLIHRLRNAGYDVKEFDIRRNIKDDIRDADAVNKAVDRVDGIVHLSAISRVVWAQQLPELAYEVNVIGLKNILAAALQQKRKPWVIFASSREVYGNAESLPVNEDARLAPLNFYAKTKCEGEQLVTEAAASGIRANICRFSNVYGSIDDHADRVVVAFARTAAFGGLIRVEGGDNMFDFTHVNDVSGGLFRLVEATHQGECLPPVHFVSGDGVTLNELATFAASHTSQHAEVEIRQAPPRNFDVAQFRGNPARAKTLLGWTVETPLPVGFENLITQFREAGTLLPVLEPWIHVLTNKTKAYRSNKTTPTTG